MSDVTYDTWEFEHLDWTINVYQYPEGASLPGKFWANCRKRKPRQRLKWPAYYAYDTIEEAHQACIGVIKYWECYWEQQDAAADKRRKNRKGEK